MHLDGHLDPVLVGESASILPVGDDDLGPLPLQDARKVWRPGSGHPVGASVLRPAARAAREHVDDWDAQRRGQAHRLAVGLVVPPGQVAVGMDGVAVDRQATDDEVAAGELVQIVVACLLALQERVHVDVVRARVVAGTNLHCIEARGDEEIQHVCQGEFAEQGIKDADSHAACLLWTQSGVSPAGF